MDSEFAIIPGLFAGVEIEELGVDRKENRGVC
jgi:hypothetical protein